MNFYWMLLLHLLYDFHWQGQFIGEYKGKYPFIMFIHSLTYGLIVSLPYVFSRNILALLISIFSLTISHYFIDSLKNTWMKAFGEEMWLVYIDQFLHLLMLVSIFFIMKGHV
jgi:hypothetical protein